MITLILVLLFTGTCYLCARFVARDALAPTETDGDGLRSQSTIEAIELPDLEAADAVPDQLRVPIRRCHTVRCARTRLVLWHASGTHGNGVASGPLGIPASSGRFRCLPLISLSYCSLPNTFGDRRIRDRHAFVVRI